MLLDGPRVTVLDLLAAHRSAVHHDIASFLNSLTLIRLTRPMPSAALRRLRRAFLGDYFGEEEPDATATAFLEGSGLIAAGLEIVGRRRSALARASVTWLLTNTLGELSVASRGNDR